MMDSDQETVIFDNNKAQQQQRRHYHRHSIPLPPITRPSFVSPSLGYPLPTHAPFNLRIPPLPVPPPHSAPHSSSYSSCSTSLPLPHHYSSPSPHVPVHPSAQDSSTSPSEYHVRQSTSFSVPRKNSVAQNPHPHTRHPTINHISSRQHRRRQISFPRKSTRYSKMRLHIGSLNLSANTFLDSLHYNKTRLLKSCWEREIIPNVPRSQRPAENNNTKDLVSGAREKDGRQDRSGNSQQWSDSAGYTMSLTRAVPEALTTTHPPLDRHRHSTQPSHSPQQGSPDCRNSPQTPTSSEESRVNCFLNQKTGTRYPPVSGRSVGFLLSMLRSSMSGFADPTPPQDTSRDVIVLPEVTHAPRKDPTPLKPTAAPTDDTVTLKLLSKLRENSTRQEEEQEHVLVFEKTSAPPRHPHSATPEPPPTHPPPPQSHPHPSPSDREGMEKRTSPYSTQPPHPHPPHHSVCSSSEKRGKEESSSATLLQSFAPPPPPAFPSSHRKRSEERASSEDRRRQSNLENGLRKEAKNQSTSEYDRKGKKDGMADVPSRQAEKSPEPARKKETVSKKVMQELGNHMDRRRKDNKDISEEKKEAEKANSTPAIANEKQKTIKRKDGNQNVKDGKKVSEGKNKDIGKNGNKESKKSQETKRPQKKVVKEKSSQQTQNEGGSKVGKFGEQKAQEKSDKPKAKRGERKANEVDESKNHTHTKKKSGESIKRGRETETEENQNYRKEVKEKEDKQKRDKEKEKSENQNHRKTEKGREDKQKKDKEKEKKENHNQRESAKKEDREKRDEGEKTEENTMHRKTGKRKKEDEQKGDEEEARREKKKQRKIEEKSKHRQKKDEKRKAEGRVDSGKRKRSTDEEKVSPRPSPKRYKSMDVPDSSTGEKNTSISLHYRTGEGENHTDSFHHRTTGIGRGNRSHSLHHHRTGDEENTDSSLHHQRITVARESNANASIIHRTTSGIEENTNISLHCKSTGSEGRNRTHTLHKAISEERTSTPLHQYRTTSGIEENMNISLHHKSAGSEGRNTTHSPHKAVSEERTSTPLHQYRTTGFEGESNTHSLHHQTAAAKEENSHQKSRTVHSHSSFGEENNTITSLHLKSETIPDCFSVGEENTTTSLHHSNKTIPDWFSLGEENTASSHHRYKSNPDYPSDGESSTCSLPLFPEVTSRHTITPPSSESAFSTFTLTSSEAGNVVVKEEPAALPTIPSKASRHTPTPPPSKSHLPASVPTTLLGRNIVVKEEPPTLHSTVPRVRHKYPKAAAVAVSVKEEPEEHQDTGVGELWGGSQELSLAIKTEPVEYIEMTKTEPFLEEDGGSPEKIRQLMDETLHTLGLDEGQGIPESWDGSTPESLYDHLKSCLVAMGCSVWEAPTASFTFTWEVNLRRLAVASLAQGDLECFTRDIYRHMKEQPSYKVFVTSLMQERL